jgi:hypothetical protein
MAVVSETESSKNADRMKLLAIIHMVVVTAASIFNYSEDGRSRLPQNVNS